MIFKVVSALILIIALILIAFMGIKALQNKKMNLFSKKKGNADSPHLLETSMIDAQRKLITVRYGSKQHLLLIGPHNDVHIDTQPFFEEGVIPLKGSDYAS